MTTDRRNTDADAELRQAVKRFEIARETPGIPTQRLYHAMRRARLRAEEYHDEREAQA